MKYSNVEAGRSDRKGAAAQAITFAVYLVSLTILAILAVPAGYFIVVAVLGLPATGIVPVVAGYLETRRHEKNWEREQKLLAENPLEEPMRVERIVNDDGLPMIRL